jgi:hypothetical protein
LFDLSAISLPLPRAATIADCSEWAAVERLHEGASTAQQMIDTSIVRVHQHAACVTQADPAKNARPDSASSGVERGRIGRLRGC